MAGEGSGGREKGETGGTRGGGGGSGGRAAGRKWGGGDVPPLSLFLSLLRRLPLPFIHSLAPLVFLSAVCHTVLLSRLTHLPLCPAIYPPPLQSPRTHPSAVSLLSLITLSSVTPFPPLCLHHAAIILSTPRHSSRPLRRTEKCALKRACVSCFQRMRRQKSTVNRKTVGFC